MFDARAAKALRAGDLLMVDGAPGLRLVATETLKTWTYRYRSPVDGRMRQVRIGHWPAVGLPAALAAWERLKLARDAGADPAAEKRTKRLRAAAAGEEQAYTVERAVSDYLAAYRATVARRTYAEAERLLLGELDTINARPAANITRADAFDLLDAMQGRPVVAAMLRQQLGAVWDRALDSGRLPPTVPNWWRMVLRGKLPSRGKIVGGEHQGIVKRVLSEAEVGALLTWLPNFSRDIQDVLTLYLWTCCRGAEIVAMERAEIGTEAGVMWWTAPRAKLKMRRNPLTTDLRVPLLGRAAAVVARRIESHDKAFVFPSRGASGHIEQKAVGVAVWTHLPGCESQREWVRPRVPVAAWAPHDLRRTGRTLLASLGCPAEVAEAILGHLLPGVQGVYDRHGYDAERLLWLKRLAERLEQIAGQGRAPDR